MHFSFHFAPLAIYALILVSYASFLGALSLLFRSRAQWVYCISPDFNKLCRKATLADFCSHWTAKIQTMMALLTLQHDEDSFENKVKLLVASRRLERIRKVVAPLLIAMAIFHIRMVGVEHLLILRDRPEAEIIQTATKELKTGYMPLSVLIFSVGIVWLLRPESLTLRSADASHAVILIVVSVRLAFAHDGFRIVFDAPTNQILRLMVAFVVGNAQMTAILNTALSCSIMAAYAGVSGVYVSGVLPEDVFFPRMSVHDIPPVCSLESSAPRTSSSVLHFSLREIFSLVVVIAMAWFFENRMMADSRVMLKLKATQQAETTVKAVLSAMCDAVVELESDMRISAPSPSLAVMLLRHSCTSQLQGTCFLDLVSAEGQEQLLQHLLENSVEEKQVAQLFHVHLLDSTSTRVDAQLFIHNFNSELHGELRHLIGIRMVTSHEGPSSFSGADASAVGIGRSGGDDNEILTRALLDNKARDPFIAIARSPSSTSRTSIHQLDTTEVVTDSPVVSRGYCIS